LAKGSTQLAASVTALRPSDLSPAIRVRA